MHIILTGENANEICAVHDITGLQRPVTVIHIKLLTLPNLARLIQELCFFFFFR